MTSRDWVCEGEERVAVMELRQRLIRALETSEEPTAALSGSA